MSLLLARIAEVGSRVEGLLSEWLTPPSADPGEIYASMRYSALAGGKRIRPFLTVEFANLFSAPEKKAEATETALRFGTALEMIHSYSLVHDDLPCMDNDDLRRGKPSNHKVYGEAGAVLAGDGLLTEAFGMAASAICSPEKALRAIRLLSTCAGASGMVGGQALDLQNENRGYTITEEELDAINSRKTGALIECACLLGCVAAGCGAGSAEEQAAKRYAAGIGRSFQLVDDLLDAIGSAALLGKNVGVDTENKKTTYVKLLGVEGCRREAERLTEDALDALALYPGSECLQELGRYLLERQI